MFEDLAVFYLSGVIYLRHSFNNLRANDSVSQVCSRRKQETSETLPVRKPSPIKRMNEVKNTRRLYQAVYTMHLTSDSKQAYNDTF